MEGKPISEELQRRELRAAGWMPFGWREWFAPNGHVVCCLPHAYAMLLGRRKRGVKYG